MIREPACQLIFFVGMATNSEEVVKMNRVVTCGQKKPKSEIATASPVRVQCQQRWVMLLTLNVGSHLNLFFKIFFWVTISRRSSFYLPLAGPRDPHTFVR